MVDEGCSFGHGEFFGFFVNKIVVKCAVPTSVASHRPICVNNSLK